MPELPEIEAARRALHDSCCGRKIVTAQIAEDSIVIDSVSPSDLQKALEGRKILDVRRKGKNLWIELDARPWPSFQFGMTGAFYIKGKQVTKYKRSAVSDDEKWPSKFSKVFLKLDDGLEVSFTDKRRLARVRLLKDPTTEPPVSELGPDALLELPDESTLANLILKKKCPIKALLLDQSFLAGIGNWVADEVLYQARVHPEQVASSLSEKDCGELHKAIREVMRISVSVDADSDRFPENWIFHYRWNKKGGELEGNKVSFISVGGRTSAYVPALQMCTTQSSRNTKNGNKVLSKDKDQTLETDIKKKRGKSKLTAENKESENDSTSINKAKRKGKNERESVGAMEEIPEPKKGRKAAKKRLTGEDETGIVEQQDQESLEPKKGKTAARKNAIESKAGDADKTKTAKSNKVGDDVPNKSRKNKTSKDEEGKAGNADKTKSARISKVGDDFPNKGNRKSKVSKDEEEEEEVATMTSGSQKRRRAAK